MFFVLKKIKSYCIKFLKLKHFMEYTRKSQLLNNFNEVSKVFKNVLCDLCYDKY